MACEARGGRWFPILTNDAGQIVNDDGGQPIVLCTPGADGGAD